MKPETEGTLHDRNIFSRIIRHETCRLLDHVWREYQVVHHTQVEPGHWSALVTEKGRQCLRCDLRADINLTRRK